MESERVGINYSHLYEGLSSDETETAPEQIMNPGTFYIIAHNIHARLEYKVTEITDKAKNVFNTHPTALRAAGIAAAAAVAVGTSIVYDRLTNSANPQDEPLSV